MRRNILITSAGRRAKLVAAFRRELDELLPGGMVFAADARPELSVACHLANASFSVPTIGDPAFAPKLLELCLEYEIGLIVPTIDPELPVLAAHLREFAERDVTIVVSDAEFIRVCRDKRETARWFTERGLATPHFIDPRACARFPIFAKPYDGSCSRDTIVVTSPADLTPNLLDDPRMMFVEYLSPADHDEYTVDMYFDRGGELRCLVPRLRLETRAGEVSKGRTQRIAAAAHLRKRLPTIAGARGCITMQLFVARRSQKVSAIEVNARFGGGYPLSYEAGANFPRWLIQEYLMGMQIDFFDGWENNLTMLRYDDHVLVRGAAA
jgi:carbamoyl-phosphate synthase large subunit